MKSYMKICSVGLLLFLFTLTGAQGVITSMLKTDAVVSTNPAPSITISWDTQLPGYNISIYRRTLGAEGSGTWGGAISTTAHPTQSYVDTNIVVGTTYEYKVYRPYYSTYNSATAYLVAGIEAPLVEARGKVLLIVDDTIATPLATELERLERDLIGDGWTVIRHDSPRYGGATGTPEILKAWILAKYNEDTANTKSLFLFGRLPIPMSGRRAPDGHESIPHATDLFYADVNGTWTDYTIDVPGVNVPGDGIYDQNYIPDDTIEMQVGRVDLAGMIYWSSSEVELLRNYLNKDHLWRHSMVTIPGRGIWGSGSGSQYMYNERASINALYSDDNLDESGTWATLAEDNAYTWGIEFGDPDLTHYPDYDFKMAFTINFGSHKQKWERSNNAMRAILAMPEYGLTCGWGARPNWYFHQMGMGKTIGYSAYRTQNNRNFADYTPVNGYSGAVHINLMGDPTLRMHVTAPPTRITTSTNGLGEIAISWLPSADTVNGYHVYRAPEMTGGFTRLTGTLVTSNNFTDSSAPAGTNSYMIRAVKLEEADTGSYYNPSQGAFGSYPNQSVELVVTTPFGIAEPPAGTNNYTLYDASLLCSIPDAFITDGTTQKVITGWIGTGDIPATGSSSSLPLTDINQNSSIDWQWGTNFWLEVTSDGNGTVNIGDSWQRLGTNVSLFATPTAFRHEFSHWTGSAVTAGHETDNPLVITMDSALNVKANFMPQENPGNLLPYVESFEQYNDNTALVGTEGWHAEKGTAVMVTTDTNIINCIIDYGNDHSYPINTTHAQATVLYSPASVDILGATNIDVMAQILIQMNPLATESGPDLSPNGTLLSFAVSTNEWFMLFHADPISEELAWSTFTNTSIAAGSWHTITMNINYDTAGVGGYKFFQIKIDSEPWLSHANGYSGNDPVATPDGTWFALTDKTVSNLKGFSFQGEAVIDDFLVSENWRGGGGDYDGDGMWDMWEYHHFGGTNQPDGGAGDDYDSDGVDNLSEYVADTSPTDTNSMLILTGVTMETNGIKVSWQGGIESLQYLDRTDKLSSTGVTWNTILTNVPPVAPTLEVLDTNDTSTTHFYRIRAERE